jgi:hypothetical protein
MKKWKNQNMKAFLLFLLPILSIPFAAYVDFRFAIDRGIGALVTAYMLLLVASGIVSFVVGIVIRKKGFCFWAICIGASLCLQISLSRQFLMPTYESQYATTLKSGEIIISAIEKYRLENQEFPRSLENLKPKYLKQVPHTKYQLFFKEEPFRLIPDALSKQNFPRLFFTKDAFLQCDYSFVKKNWYCN